MARSAQDIFEHTNRKHSHIQTQNLTKLRNKAIDAVTEMMKAGEYYTEVELTDEDVSVVSHFGKELRSLEYQYCLIETVNEENEVLQHRLRISVDHLRGL